MRDLVELAFRHKRKAIFFFLAVVSTTLIVLICMPDEYTSTAKLMVRRGREGLFLDTSSSAGNALPIYKEWESEINTELEILGSRELVIEVAHALEKDLTGKKQPPPEEGLLKPVQTALSSMREWVGTSREQFSTATEITANGKNLSSIDKAVEILEKNLLIEARKKSDIITVSYTADSPELARKVVNQLVNIYLDRRIDVHRVPGAQQFFGQQTEQLMKELKTAEQSISAIKNDAGISSLEDSRRYLLTARETVRALQLENEAALASAQARVMTLRNMLSKQTSSNVTGQNNALLDREERLELQITLHNEEITQAALTAEAKELALQLTQLQLELAEINTLDAPLHELKREQELLEIKYRKYYEDKEQARINEELETRKISNVRIVQNATLPVKSDPSGKPFKAIAAVLIGLLGAMGIAYGADSLDPTLHSSSDISEHLHLKTMLELPIFRNEKLYYFVHPYAKKNSKKPRLKHSKHSIQREVNDYFQELLFKILATQEPDNSQPFLIGVTSGSSDEGVSSIAANLATAFALDDRFADTLLLDASLKEAYGSLSEQMETAPFTYEHIESEEPSEDSKDGLVGIKLFTDRLTKFEKEDHDVIVVDLPPVSQGGGSIRMAAALDCTLLVITAESTHWRDAKRGAELLTGASAKLCGAILNRKHFAMPQWLYRKL